MCGSFIREVRESRRLSQEVLAEVAGVSQPNLSAYERGRRTPTADTLNRILVACGYQLAASDGEDTIFCALPTVGWFPDEDLPPSEPGDPGDQRPAVTPDTPMPERVRVLLAVLEVAEATR
ncbi:MAG: helix-turn-helix domain-containing protein [Acidimicrobiia bacterium]